MVQFFTVLYSFRVAKITDENNSPMLIIFYRPHKCKVRCFRSPSKYFMLKHKKQHKRNNYQKPAQWVMCVSNLLKLVKRASNLTEKLLIVQIKRGCHQQNATLHDANTHMTRIHMCLDHREQNCSSSHKQSSPLHSVYILNTYVYYM